MADAASAASATATIDAAAASCAIGARSICPVNPRKCPSTVTNEKTGFQRRKKKTATKKACAANAKKRKHSRSALALRRPYGRRARALPPSKKSSSAPHCRTVNRSFLLLCRAFFFFFFCLLPPPFTHDSTVESTPESNLISGTGIIHTGIIPCTAPFCRDVASSPRCMVQKEPVAMDSFDIGQAVVCHMYGNHSWGTGREQVCAPNVAETSQPSTSHQHFFVRRHAVEGDRRARLWLTVVHGRRPVL